MRDGHDRPTPATVASFTCSDCADCLDCVDCVDCADCVDGVDCLPPAAGAARSWSPHTMRAEERNAAMATAGLAIVAVGTFLPWARIGGRNRSGFNTADTFISLADGALPDIVAWVGRWWYLPALLALVAWSTTFLAGRWPVRAVGLGSVAIAGAMWWLFAWAGEHYGVLNVHLAGPIVTTLGLVVVAAACARHRRSILRN